MTESNKQYIISAIVIFLIALHYVTNPLKIEVLALKTITVGLLMIALWILEIIPMPVVALLPLIIFPLWQIEPLSETAKNYADPIIFLFMGGFFLAIAIEKWNLHQRIALNILHKTGSNGNQILLGFMFSTFLISMWMSNTATTLMMFPIAISILKVMQSNYSPAILRNFSIALLLSIAYAANIGGLATIIGTPPNAAYVAFMNDQQNAGISFSDWMIISFPISLLILICIYLVFIYISFPNKIKNDKDTEIYIQNQIQKLGNWSIAEKRVAFVFLLTAFLWITKDLWVSRSGLALNDTIIALTGGILLFLVPAGMAMESPKAELIRDEEKPNRIVNLLEWDDTRKMAWGILLLFGGGLALAKSLENHGVMKMIGDSIAAHAPRNQFLLIVLVATVSIFLSEIMSNIAQVIVMAPILTAVAIAIHINPIILGLPMTLAASCAGMLPMGTPPNAIVYASGQIPLHKMLRAGFLLNLISILLISVVCYFFTNLIFT